MSIYTKKAIMDSFVKMLSQKSFDKITIKDIIEDCGLNRTLLDNIMILGLRHAIEPLDAESQPVQWELP